MGEAQGGATEGSYQGEVMLPKTVYVKLEEDGDQSYLVADFGANDLIDLDEEETEIGEYRLVRKVKYTMQVKEMD